MFEMGFHDPFGYLKHKLWPKEGSGIKLAIWLPTTKNQELPWFPYVHVVCHIPLETSWWKLQLCFRSHLNWRSTHKVICLQICGSPNFGNFETTTWESWTKCHLGAGHVARHRVYYKGEGSGFPKSGLWWVLWVHVSPWLVCAPKGRKLCTN